MREVKRALNPPPSAQFAVVLNPGTLLEEVDCYTQSMASAMHIARDIGTPDMPADVMRVIPATLDQPARLTTEF